jgi:hypothetical protein
MGHEGYLTQVYRRYGKRDLADFYQRGEHALRVFGGEELSQVEERTHQLQTIINGLVNENMELKKQMNQQDARIDDMKRTIKRIMDYIGDALQDADADDRRSDAGMDDE